MSDGHSEIRISNKRDGSICQRWLYSCDDSIVEEFNGGLPVPIMKVVIWHREQKSIEEGGSRGRLLTCSLEVVFERGHSMSSCSDWMGMLSKGLFSCVLVFVVSWFFCSRGDWRIYKLRVCSGKWANQNY
ncbi:mannosyl phosphorylinositol ceramide synthaseCSH1 [Striga asiatica]|uniref:Mannosyl phosphorylinositol ceramide synthaseCSH1 n=1 Tax=Striga asiatica TaxID=4170 RepID=A0A5A7Q3Y6_STRAF|nr:mannosyl phosphorylinositol ceramide synthaseCSH1 [Striga asiatica]